jgi:hypothetical protein
MKLRFGEGNLSARIGDARFLRAARRYVRSAYPNPERVGCPGRDHLELLARRKTPLRSEDIHHITTCSPCFIDYRRIRKARKRRYAAAVAVLVACPAIFFFLAVGLPNRHSVPGDRVANQAAKSTQAAPVDMVADLRPFQPMRGTSAVEGRASGPITLPRLNLNVTILLPVGSEAGRYQLKLIDHNGVPRFQTAAEGIIKDYITRLATKFDVRPLASGPYTLTIQRSGSLAINSYPVEVD